MCMYACMYVCMYVVHVCLYVRMCVCMCSMPCLYLRELCMCNCMCRCTSLYTYRCTSIGWLAGVHMYVSTCIRTFVLLIMCMSAVFIINSLSVTIGVCSCVYEGMYAQVGACYMPVRMYVQPNAYISMATTKQLQQLQHIN